MNINLNHWTKVDLKSYIMDIVESEIVKTLKNKRIAMKLITNERNNRITNTGGAYLFLNKEGKYQPLSGLLPRLKLLFWKDTNIYNIMKKPQKRGLTGMICKTKSKKKYRRGKMIQKATPVKKNGKGRFYGVMRGTEVHREIQDFIELDQKNFLKRHPCIHFYTRQILAFVIEKMHWRPFKSEFDIFDEKLGIGTSIDLICLGENDKLICIEIKSGYAGYFENNDGYMDNSLSNLTNSPRNQAYIQLITSCLMLIKNHHLTLNDIELYVIRVDDNNLSHYKISKEYVQQRGPHIYQDLLIYNANKH